MLARAYPGGWSGSPAGAIAVGDPDVRSATQAVGLITETAAALPRNPNETLLVQSLFVRLAALAACSRLGTEPVGALVPARCLMPWCGTWACGVRVSAGSPEGGEKRVDDMLAEADPGQGRPRDPVLGPVEIAWDGRPIDIGGVKARALVARLVFDRQIVVSVDRLVDSLWGDNDGPGAEIAMRSTVSRLRKRIHGPRQRDDLIVTRAPGYVLEVPAEVTDALRLERLVAEARRNWRAQRPSECVRLTPRPRGSGGAGYSEVHDEPFARAEARRLEELRLAATETGWTASSRSASTRR